MPDWQDTSFGCVCTIRNEQVKPDCFNTDMYIGLEHIDSGNPRITRYGDPTSVRSAKSKFYPSDVLYGKLRPYLDKAVLVDFEGVCSTDILVIKTDNELSAPEYLAFLVHTRPFIDHAIKTTSGVNHPRTSWNSISQLRFVLPPLPEQRSIATVLSKIQEAIAAQQEIIDRTRELKKALMAKLFTEGLRGEPTKETEIGPIPESWEVVKIDDVCRQISVGIVVKPAQYYVEEGVPCFRSANIKPDYLNDTNLVYISEDSNKSLAKSILRAGDILFVRTGYPGTACVVPEKYDGANCIDLIFARPKSIVTSQYLSRFINSDAGSKQVIVGNNSAQQHFNVGAVKQMLIPLPSLEEQKLISEIVESVDDRINVTDQKVNALKDLFKTMLHELMTGNIRTTPLMEA